MKLFESYRYCNFIDQNFQSDSFFKDLEQKSRDTQRPIADILNTLDQHDYGDAKYYSIFWLILNSKTEAKYPFALQLLEKDANPNLSFGLGFGDMTVEEKEDWPTFAVVLKLMEEGKFNREKTETIKKYVIRNATKLLQMDTIPSNCGWDNTEMFIACIRNIIKDEIYQILLNPGNHSYAYLLKLDISFDDLLDAARKIETDHRIPISNTFNKPDYFEIPWFWNILFFEQGEHSGALLEGLLNNGADPSQRIEQNFNSLLNRFFSNILLLLRILKNNMLKDEPLGKIKNIWNNRSDRIQLFEELKKYVETPKAQDLKDYVANTFGEDGTWK